VSYPVAFFLECNFSIDTAPRSRYVHGFAGRDVEITGPLSVAGRGLWSSVRAPFLDIGITAVAYAGGADGAEAPEMLNILGVFSCLV